MIRSPTPTANPSITRHIMYLEGAGRETPYLSTSELRDIASLFAGPAGSVWSTSLRATMREGVEHWSQAALMMLLRGRGKGKARWSSAHEVLQARRYVEEWKEHLLDFTSHRTLSRADVAKLVSRIFAKV